MRKNENSVHLEGRLYQCDLEIKTVKNADSANFGKEFIQGAIHIATDEEGMNVVPVYYTYVTPTTKAGKPNATFSLLKRFIDDPNTAWIKGGKENAAAVIVDSSIALNEFYVEENGESTLVSAKRVEGGFISLAQKGLSENPEARNIFKADMLITNTAYIEPNEEKGLAGYLDVRGAIFNFKNDLLPISFKLKAEDGITYFESLGIQPSNPLYVQVWGPIECSTITETKEVKAAFGKNAVQISTKSFRDWVITSIAETAYEFGEEGVLTADEVTKAMQDREVMLAEKKSQREEYLAKKNAAPAKTGFPAVTPAPTPSVNPGGFTF